MRHLASIQSVTHKYTLQIFPALLKSSEMNREKHHQKAKKERAGSGGEGRGEIQQLMRPQTFVH